MFIDSSKVKVVESNITDDKIGPIAGSVGYVIPHWENFNYVVNDIKQYMSSNGPMQNPPDYSDNNKKNGNIGAMEDGGYYYYFKEMNVVFTRFGKDGTARCEKKPVINVFPLPKKADVLKKGLPEKLLTDIVNEYIYSYVESNLSDRKVARIPTICVMIPHYTDSPEDITLNDHEYESWCRSVLENGLLNLYSTACRHSRFANNNNITTFIVDYVREKGHPPRLSLVEERLNNDRKEVVKLLRQLLLSTVNNFDLTSARSLRSQGFPGRLRDRDFFDKGVLLCAHAWRIGFNANKNVLSVEASGMRNIATLVASVQQELLSRSI